MALSCLFRHSMDGCVCSKCGNTYHAWVDGSEAFGGYTRKMDSLFNDGIFICEKCGVYGFGVTWSKLRESFKAAFRELGKNAFEIPFITPQLEKKVFPSSVTAMDFTLSAYEIVGLHNLLTSTKAFKEDKDVETYVLFLQDVIKENTEEVIILNTPEIKKKLNMC